MKRFSRLMIPVICVVLATLAGCGIEEFIYLYPVLYEDFTPSATDEATDYISFWTSDASNSSSTASGNFKGFEIYYRIYNYSSTRDSDEGSINSYNSSYPTTAYSYLINTKNYQRLVGSSQLTGIPLIAGSTSDRKVLIRLLSDQSELPQISVAGDTATYGTPLRTNSTGSTSFLWKKNSAIPFVSGDSDFTCGSTWSTNTSGNDVVFVQFYVMAYGYDSSFKSLYSELKDLGSITLAENDN